MKFILSIFILIVGIFALSPVKAEAKTTSYLITSGFDTMPNSPSDTVGHAIFISNAFYFGFYQPGSTLTLSRNPDGTGEAEIGDMVSVISVRGADSISFEAYNHNTCALKTMPPLDASRLLRPGDDNIFVRISNYCITRKHISSLYLVYTQPDPTPTIMPTPTPTPAGPEPFLDLPWDYQSKGQTFTDAALAITSYFDHEYPLLSGGITEPDNALGTIIDYKGERTKNSYSSHDGYDYATIASVHMGDSVLAAAAGWATYVNSCGACGNMITIDHDNGYQTRYMHMQPDGLVTNVPGQKVWVSARQVIGKVGWTGHINPPNPDGSHIHFGVFEDKNHDGNFEDNVPDGVTDPYGWLSKDPDPWEHYTFTYNGSMHTGNKSYYLWKNKIMSLEKLITTYGGTAGTNQFALDFKPNTSIQNFFLTLQSSPVVETSANLLSVGPSLMATAVDILGNEMHQFLVPLTITVDFSKYDLSDIDVNTLSLYSTTDGINWQKEPTSLDLANKKAVSSVNHFTQFALMGQKADVTPPVTAKNLSGDQGQAGFFHSDVALSLDAKDNDGGKGVEYTLYHKDHEDWQLYTTPLTFTDEGKHTISFYSADQAGNIEAVKTTTFSIDKTVPEALFHYDIKANDFSLVGQDNDTELTILSDNQTQWTIADRAGNVLRILGTKKTTGNPVTIAIDSIQYNAKAAAIFDKNKLTASSANKNGELDKLDQTLTWFGDMVISTKYDSQAKQTTIKTRIKGEDKTTETKNGIVVLQLFTQQGTLKYSY